MLYTNADSQKERSAVHLKVYPKLREYCAERGCELQVLDFLWGLRDEFLHGHVIRNFSESYVTKLCQREKNVIVTVSYIPHGCSSVVLHKL
jgi:hypothetical protein